MNKFWNFDTSNGGRTLRLDGAIAEEIWWGDEVTPATFKAELLAGNGDITVWINSPPRKYTTCSWNIPAG